MLYDCCKVKPLIEYVTKLSDNVDYELTYESWIFNKLMKDPNHVINLIALICKQLVYRCRCTKKKPTVQLLCNEIEFIQRIEFQEAHGNNKLAKYNARWGPVGLEVIVSGN